MPYNLPAPSTLEDVFRMNPAAFAQAQQFMQGGVQQNEADLRKTQLANVFDEQNDPLRVEHQRGMNRAQDAQLPGLYADSSMRQRKDSNEGALNNDALEKARREFAANASDHDIKMLENEAQKMTYSLNPKERAKGLNLMAMHRDLVKEREKKLIDMETDLEKIRETGNQARLTQQEGIAGGRYVKGSAGKPAATFEETLRKMTKASSRHAALLDAARMADQENKPELAESYRARAEDQRAQAEAELQANAKPGTPNLPGLGVEANPSISISPKPATKTLLSKLPQGTTDNGNGTFTLPDGRKVRPKSN